jgi:hypothetical protein
MKKLQDKNNTNFSELQTILNKKNSMVGTHASIETQFDIQSIRSYFKGIKCRGIESIYIFKLLILLPFLGFMTINQLFKNKKQNNIVCCKDCFYTLKRNPKIDWRRLLYIIIKRFKGLLKKTEFNNINIITAFIFDDSTTPKRGKKIEKMSRVWDHVSGISILGFKLLIMGYWDGTSFIPIDLSLHREKGTQYQKIQKLLKKKSKELKKSKLVENNIITKIKKIKSDIKEAKKAIKKNSTQKLKKQLEYLKKRLDRMNKQLNLAAKEVEQSRKEYNRVICELRKTTFYGLTSKERKQQYKKNRTKDTAGYKRVQETQIKKTENAEKMLKRAVKQGFISDYVLTDSWFFCYNLVKTTRKIAKEKMHFLGMASMSKQGYIIGDKEYTSKELLKIHKEKAQRCRKLRAKYIQIQATMKDIVVNLFFIRLGGKDHWRLLVTTDLKLSFIKLMEIYQIRWSIEVFFKDTKQYLNLGKCQSTDFDAQIAEVTIVLMQYILLDFYKRIHFQDNSIGGLFEKLSSQIIRNSIVTQIWNLFLELQQVVSEIIGINIFDLFMQALLDTKVQEIIEKILEQTAINTGKVEINNKKTA